jgi:hypothetical protein
MRRLLGLALLAVLAAGCVPGTPTGVGESVVVWEDPDRPVVCYRYDDSNTGSEFDCVVVP